jgi:hypothetical protein
MGADHRPCGEAPPITVEQRLCRLAIPPCQQCSVPDPRVVSRTDYVIYVRCEQCAHVWSIEKPTWASTHAATTESQALRAHAEQVRETSRSLRKLSREILNSSFGQLGVIAIGKRRDDDDSDS